jgi:hypothetical protein
MPGPISIGFLVGGYAALHVAARHGTAVSSVAQALRETAAVVVSSTEESQALFGAKAEVISQIWALVEECAEDDWDGAGAQALSYDVAAAAEDFVRALPDGIPLPEVAPEPEGSISLDWIQSRRCVFSLSVGASDRFAYAWLDGTDKGHGVARFDGVTAPSRVVEGIRSVVSSDHAAIRLA